MDEFSTASDSDERHIEQGIRIISARKALGINQKALSIGSDTQQSHISAMENGHKKIQIEVLEYLYKRYNVNAGWILTGEGEMIFSEEKLKKADTGQFPNFGINLSELRGHTNMAASDLASRLKITVDTITDLEKGRLAPDLQTLILIREVFGVPIDTLLFEDLSLDEMTQIKENASLFIKQQEQINQLMKVVERIGEKVDKVVDRVEKIETTGKK